MITMIEEDWGVSDQGTGEYVESETEKSWWDKFVEWWVG